MKGGGANPPAPVIEARIPDQACVAGAVSSETPFGMGCNRLESVNAARESWRLIAATPIRIAIRPAPVVHVSDSPINVQPISTRMLLIAEQSFVLTAVECLLGGSPDRPPRERRLTEIDWTLTRRVERSGLALSGRGNPGSFDSADSAQDDKKMETRNLEFGPHPTLRRRSVGLALTGRG